MIRLAHAGACSQASWACGDVACVLRAPCGCCAGACPRRTQDCMVRRGGYTAIVVDSWIRLSAKGECPMKRWMWCLILLFATAGVSGCSDSSSKYRRSNRDGYRDGYRDGARDGARDKYGYDESRNRRRPQQRQSFSKQGSTGRSTSKASGRSKSSQSSGSKSRSSSSKRRR